MKVAAALVIGACVVMALYGIDACDGGQVMEESPVVLHEYLSFDEAERKFPGLGPHVQHQPPLSDYATIRDLLGCPEPRIVCCDPCDVCVCEHSSEQCPDIMIAGVCPDSF